ncbi:hypothetical protein ACQPZF_27960 [Actinosynnema sp. CS-041913]|uniref:hypothetical protein n=1 Tax=Actinosynnema sp. CS-041913 TaxID=3239917 RepID=UPI003D9235CF
MSTEPAPPGTGAIWVGDLARAAHVLGITDAGKLRTTAALLGLVAVRERPVTPIVVEHVAVEVPVTVVGDLPGDPPLPEQPDAPADTTADAPGQASTPAAFPTIPDVAWTTEEHEPDVWRRVKPVPEPEERHLDARPRHVSLLSPRSERAILQTMLSRPVPDGKVDMPALVDSIARGLPIRALPRENVRTSRFGVQVLVDVGPAMAPFATDQRALVDQVRAVVGKHATEVRHFADSPLRGVWHADGDVAGPYHPPAPGCRVLLLSDLGLGGSPLERHRSRRAEWARFTTILRWHGCSPIGLLPFPPRRWPGWLRALLPLVCWDRTTTVSGARARSSWD